MADDVDAQRLFALLPDLHAPLTLKLLGRPRGWDRLARAGMALFGR